jgi:hypothetical protein
MNIIFLGQNGLSGTTLQIENCIYGKICLVLRRLE